MRKVFTLTPAQHEKLRVLAKRFGCAEAEAIRRLIENAFDRDAVLTKQTGVKNGVLSGTTWLGEP